MRPTLCDTFRSRALWTWDTLARGRSVDCQIGEETLTDLNILELKTRHSSEIYNRTFTKPEEGLNGSAVGGGMAAGVIITAALSCGYRGYWIRAIQAV